MDKDMQREIILDNYQNPFNKELVDDDNYIRVNTNSESCIDNVDIMFLIKEDKIIDARFDGEACAISTSACSIMLRNLIGKSIKELKNILTNYENMINEKSYNEEILNDLIVYKDIYKQANRKGCALLPVKSIKKIIDIYEQRYEK